MREPMVVHAAVLMAPAEKASRSPARLTQAWSSHTGQCNPILALPACFTSMNAIPSRFGLEPDFNPILTRLQPKPNPIKR